MVGIFSVSKIGGTFVSECKEVPMKHNVKVLVETKNGRQELLNSRHLRIREKILKFLFGDYCEVLILNPSKQIEKIQIEEVKE